MLTELARRRRLGWQAGLVVADALSAAAALHVALVVGRGDLTLRQAWAEYAWEGGLLAALWMLSATKHPGYLPRPHRPLITVAGQALLAVAGGSIACIASLYVVAPAHLPGRALLVPASLVMSALMVLTRQTARRLAPRGAFMERYLLLGGGERAQAITQELGDGRSPHKAIVGVVPLAGDDPTPGAGPVLGPPACVPGIVEREAVTHLIVCHPQPLPDAAARCVAECEAAGVEVYSMEAAYEMLTRRVPLFHVGDEWIASLEASSRTLYATRAKRLVDIALAGLGLVLTGPLIGLLAAMVKVTSPGPAFYNQERVGSHGKRFRFTKLRTMVQDAEAGTGPVWATEDDPRITPLGRCLRRSRLDELPQLWSVLKGDMSLVGPRPERDHFVEQFTDQIPLYGKRLLVLPGITGWAQVHHGYDESVEDVIEKLRYDLFYVNHVSLKLDLLVLLKTIEVVLHGRGAH